MIRDYVIWTDTTAGYDSREKAITCCLLGISGEFGEYNISMLNDNPDMEALKKEMGDILWYLAHLSFVTGVPLVEMGDEVSFDDDGYQLITSLHEKFKKIVRDDNYIVTEEKMPEVQVLMGLIYTMIINECGWYYWDIEDIMRANMAKLESRKERGVIGGSGDNR